MIDFDRLQDDAVRLLGELIRFDTSNPPGNETPAADFIAGELESVGYEPVLMESAPGRGNVVVRLEGSKAGRPLLLFGHLDVVPTEPAHWTHPPFEGKVHDGFMWGRGSLDMKHIVASQLAIMLALKRAGVALKRDVIFAATADEEAGGRMGIIWLRDHHPELIAAQYGLTEFGGFSLEVGGKRFYMCQTGEKGFVWLKMHAEGRPGHGSMPHADSAVLKIGEAVTKLGRHSPPLHVCETSRAMVEGMAVVEPALLALLHADKVDFVLSKLPPEQALLFNAILRNTVTVTGLEAGYKHNVIPGEATANLDCRIVPGQTEHDVIDEVRAVVGEGFEFEIVGHSPATESPLDTELYESMVKHLRDYDPEGIVVPMLLVGGTDGRHLAPGGLIYYGYSPIRLPAELKFMQLVHGHDERIPVAEYREGAVVLARTVLDFCSA
jgi:acetylornithine deacetylase/succinyl-diaminopimelate desuccinylase-like protein